MTVENLWQIGPIERTDYLLLGRYIHHQTMCKGTGSVVSYFQGTRVVCDECCQKISTKTKCHRCDMLFRQEPLKMPAILIFFANYFFRLLGVACFYTTLWTP